MILRQKNNIDGSSGVTIRRVMATPNPSYDTVMFISNCFIVANRKLGKIQNHRGDRFHEIFGLREMPAHLLKAELQGCFRGFPKKVVRHKSDYASLLFGHTG